MSREEADLMRPSQALSGSEWAERYARIPRRGNAAKHAAGGDEESIPFSLELVPYLREILDVLADFEHEEVVLMKPPQVAGSTLGRVALGCWSDTRGDPILIVYPTEDAAAEEITERVAPMFQVTPRLRRHLTGRAYDVNESQIVLASSTIYVGWSGSAQALASRAIGCAVYEETDKVVRKQAEAPQEDLIRHRLKTFVGRRKLFALSTPTTRVGTIWRMHSETTHKREYYCPCPSCGALTCWTFDHVRWEGRGKIDEKEPHALLDQIEGVTSGALRSWIECPHCSHEIEDGDTFGEGPRMDAVRAGEWVSTGHEPGVFPKSKRIAYHLEALVSPWVTIGEYVEAYLRGVLAGDLQNFLNGFRGLPAEEVSGKVETSVFEERARAHPAFLVPTWAHTLTAGADTQASDGKPWWQYVVRAWGPGLRSRTIAVGRADSREQLVAETIDRAFPCEDGRRAPMAPALLCVDSGGGVETEDGSTTDLVYALAKSDPARIVATKGHAGSTRPDRLVRTSNVDFQLPGMPPTSVLLHTVDTEGAKDIVARLIRSTGPELWEESSAADARYVEQMTAEEKVRVRIGRRWRFTWINTTRRRNDIWDATILSFVAARILKVEERALGPSPAVAAARAVAQIEKRAAEALDAPVARAPENTRSDEQPRRFGARRREGGGWVSRRAR